MPALMLIRHLTIFLVLIPQTGIAECSQILANKLKVDHQTVVLRQQQIQEHNLSLIDTNTILVIMGMESRYKEDAVSPAGAVGLMQITPVAAKAVELYPDCNPKHPYTTPIGSIQYGSCFLQKLLERYGHPLLMPAHYHGGARGAQRLRTIVPMGPYTANYVARFAYLISLCNK